MTADFLGELQTGYALAGGDDDIHGVEPLVERDVGPAEYGAGADGELFLAVSASVVAGALAGSGADLLGRAASHGTTWESSI